MSSILGEPNHLSAKNTNLKSAFLKRLETALIPLFIVSNLKASLLEISLKHLNQIGTPKYQLLK